MQRVWVARGFEGTAALACFALASACITSHSEQREAVATSPVVVAAPVPVATSSLAAAPEPERPERLADRPPPPARPDPVQRVLEAARADLGKRGGSSGVDCSTYVRSAFLAGGVDLYAAALPRDNGVQAIHRYVRKHGRLFRTRHAAKGDVVFFDNSYDRNGNRLLDDPLTHVGIVEDVLADGTALVLHATNHGVVREPMNLRRPHAIKDPRGQQINAALRRRSAFDSPRTPHLMSELFAGFGRVLGVTRDAHPVARRSARSLRAR
jgi:cell wall-associated NlpC family hydrolase